MSTAQPNVCPNRTENTLKRIGAFPGSGKCTDGSTAGTADGPVIAILGEPNCSAIRRRTRFNIG